MRRIALFFAFALLLAGLILPFSATAQSEDPFQDPVEFRLIHLVPDAPPVDVYLNGELVLEEIAFGEAAPWTLIEEDRYAVAVTISGDVLENAVLSVDDLDLTAPDPFTRLSVVAYGSVERGTLSAQLIREDYNPTEDARLELFHAFERGPVLDLLTGDTLLLANLGYPGTFGDNDGHFSLVLPAGDYDDLRLDADQSNVTLLGLEDVTLAPGTSYFIAAVGPVTSGQLLVISSDIPTESVAAPAESTSEATEAPTAEATDEATEAPSEATEAPTAEATAEATEAPSEATETPSPEATDEPTAEVTPAATDLVPAEATEDATPEATAEPTEALATPDGPLFVSIRVLLMVPDMPTVDIYLNEILISGQSDFGSITDWLRVPSGNVDIDVVPQGATVEDAVFSVENVQVAVPDDNQRLSVAVIGSALNNSVTVQTFLEDYTPVGGELARLELFHAIEGGPAVDIFLGPDRVVSQLAYPGSQGENDGQFGLNIEAGTYTVQVVGSAELSEIATLEGFVVEPNYSYLVVVAADTNNQPLIIRKAFSLE